MTDDTKNQSCCPQLINMIQGRSAKSDQVSTSNYRRNDVSASTEHRHDHPMRCMSLSHPMHYSRYVKMTYCCLMDKRNRCHRMAGDSCLSKRTDDILRETGLDLYLDNRAAHGYICDQHKQIISDARVAYKRKKVEADSLRKKQSETTKHRRHDEDHRVPSSSQTLAVKHVSPSQLPRFVDVSSLSNESLRKYKKHFKLTVKGNQKPQLVDAVRQHLSSIPVNEKEAVSFFLYQIKKNNYQEEMRSTFLRPRMRCDPRLTSAAATVTSTTIATVTLNGDDSLPTHLTRIKRECDS